MLFSFCYIFLIEEPGVAQIVRINSSGHVGTSTGGNSDRVRWRWVGAESGSHTYRAHFTGFCSASCSSCWCGCSCDFAHRLQSFAPDRHLLLVVVVVALLLVHEQLVAVAGKVRRALGDLRVGRGRRRRCLGLEFGRFRCGCFLGFLLVFFCVGYVGITRVNQR